MADPRTTGTLADGIEAIPNLAPIKPSTVDLSPAPSFGETYRAGRRVQRADRSDFETIMLRDGYAPILEALDLGQGQNPAGFSDLGAMGAKGEPMLQSSDILRGQGRGWMGSMTNRSTQERLIAEQIRARRAKDPKFLAGVPDDVAGLRAYFIAQEKAKRAPAQATVERSRGLSGLLASVAGSAVEAFHDPVNIATLPVGGGGRTVLGIAAREFLVNGVLEAIQQPIVASNREIIGEELTAGEAVTNVAVAGAFGSALEVGFHLGGKALSGASRAAIDKSPTLRKAIERITKGRAPAPVDPLAPADPLAPPPAAADPVDLGAELDNRELARAARELIGEENLTDDERAALATLEREQEVGEASPFTPGPAGNVKHSERLSDAIAALENNRPARGADTPAPVAGAPTLAPERSPSGSTPAARPQAPTATVNGEAAIAGFKAKTRRAESGQAGNLADNPNSSADGLYQFTDGTFRSYYKRIFGRDLGKHPPIEIKRDGAVQERLMDALTRDNAARLQSIGAAVTEGNLYLLHFAGEAGGAKILRADPDTPIERILTADAIEANDFLKGKSASQVIAWAHGKMGGKAASIAPRGPAGGPLTTGAVDPRIAQLREEALALGDQIVGMTRLADSSPVQLEARSVPASAIGVDATRFQFKSGGDDFGVTERLKGISEWDAGLAGRVTLWEDEAGKLWIADGHQRHGLASRISAETGGDVRLDAMVLRSGDGVSAEDARVWAALKNIAEGTGTSVDAAKVLRDAGFGALDRLPPKSPLVRDGAALARLSDQAFGAVYNERIPADYAAVIGHLLPDAPDTHIGMIDLLIKVDPANRAQAQSIVRQAIAAGFHKEEQLDLLGESTSVASLFLEKAKILERGLARLRKMRLVHKTAANEADELEAKGSKIARAQSEKEAQANAEAVEIIDRLAYRAGPVADALTDAARQLAEGGRLADAADRFVARIRELDLRALASGNEGDRGAVDGIGRAGDGGQADPAVSAEPSDPGQPELDDGPGFFDEQPSLIELESATARFSDPDGPAVKQQAESVVHDLRADLDAKERFEVERNSSFLVGIAGALDGGEAGRVGAFQWRRMQDAEGDWISVVEDGVEGDGGDDIDHLLTRGLELVKGGKIREELKPELARILAEIERPVNQVVDADGKPLTVFHATDYDFDEFDTTDFGSWFAEKRSTAEDYLGRTGEGTPRMIEATIDVRRPLIIPEHIDLSETTTVADSLAAINEANGTSFTPEDLGTSSDGSLTWAGDYEGNAAEWIGLDDRLPNLARANGFDGMLAFEQGERTWNVFSSDRITTTADGRKVADGDPADAMLHAADVAALIASGADTRGKGFQLHGARGEVPNLTEGYYNPNNIYGGMDTFYTTDAADIAGGYRRRNPEGRIYQAVEREPVKFFDMQEAIPVADIERLFGVNEDSIGLTATAIDEAATDGQAKLVDVMDEIRDQSAGEGVSKDEVQEIFDAAIWNLREGGFGGMTHIGGVKTGRDPHTVKIYFDAPNQIDLIDVTPPRAGNDAEAPAPALTRREQIKAATAALEGLKPGEFRTVEPFPKDEPGYRRFRYVAEDGTTVGGNYTIDGGPPPFVEGFSVGDANSPVKLGVGEVRKLFAQIKAEHPEIERIHAFRMTGAREKAGSGPQEMWIDLTGKKPAGSTAPEEVEIRGGEPPEIDAANDPAAIPANDPAPALDLGAAVDPAQAARDQILTRMRAASPLRAAGDVDQKGEIGLGLFDAVDQGALTFRLEDGGEDVTAKDLLAELDADDKAIQTLRGCL